MTAMESKSCAALAEASMTAASIALNGDALMELKLCASALGTGDAAQAMVDGGAASVMSKADGESQSDGGAIKEERRLSRDGARKPGAYQALS